MGSQWVERFGATPFGLRPHTQGSTFKVEKIQAARIKGIVASFGYKSVSLGGVCRVYLEAGSGNAEVGSGNWETDSALRVWKDK